MIDTFVKAEQYILDIPKFASKNEPEMTRRFLECIGDISKQVPTVHVAGTNGKGSVCALLRDALTTGGYSVATFTSPHLVSIRERFMIGRKMISEEEFLDCFNAVKDKLASDEFKGFHPSFFEFLFFMANVWFARIKPDAVILETGLGGRLDATSSIESPALCIITEIGFDHMEYLGNTIESIAFEKAGILVPGVPVVYIDGEISGEVIKNRACKLGSEAFPVRRDSIKSLKALPKGIDFYIESNYYRNVHLSVKTRALYQSENALIAFTALEVLVQRKVFDLSLSDITKGFENMEWPGRMEEAERDIILDGAHNEDGIRAFLKSVGTDGAVSRHLVFSAVSDKQVEKITGMITGSGLFDHIYTAPLMSSRASSIDRLKECFISAGTDVLCFDSAYDAYLYMKSALKPGEKGYVAGSLYLVGEIKAALQSEDQNND